MPGTVMFSEEYKYVLWVNHKLRVVSQGYRDHFIQNIGITSAVSQAISASISTIESPRSAREKRRSRANSTTHSRSLHTTWTQEPSLVLRFPAWCRAFGQVHSGSSSQTVFRKDCKCGTDEERRALVLEFVAGRSLVAPPLGTRCWPK